MEESLAFWGEYKSFSFSQVENKKTSTQRLHRICNFITENSYERNMLLLNIFFKKLRNFIFPSQEGTMQGEIDAMGQE